MKKNNNEKISIIIPAFNCEKYIERNLKSILNQKYKNIEVIVVNDGSTDNTLNIVENISNQDSRVIIVNKENAGVSSARNTGIQYSTGEYIGFVDADDFIDNDMYFNMINTIKDNSADICLISYYEIINNIKSERYFPWDDNIKVFKNNEIYNYFFPFMISKLKNEKNIIFGAVWRILIKSSIAKETKFNTELTIGEDFLFLTDCLLKSNKIIAMNDCMYNYVKNIKSATEKYKSDFEFTNEKFHNELLIRLNKMNFFENKENKIRYGLNKFKMYTMSFSNLVKKSNASKYELKSDLKKLLLNFKKEKYINKEVFYQLDLKNKLIYLLIKLKLNTVILSLFLIKNNYKLRLYKTGEKNEN